MRQVWFKTLSGVFAVVILAWAAFYFPQQAEAFQDSPTPTGIFITVTYTDPINVRSGPSTIQYPIVGQLAPGEVVPALGISPGREWIQVTLPAGGTGWVYASFVSISGGELRILEPPPTPTPLATMTIDLTLAAEFAIPPTQTRLPTFTPPPPLQVPEFPEVSGGNSFRASGFFILGLGLLGAGGLIISLLWRK